MGQKYNLPTLPFDTSSLSPFISEETFQYHWGKHHRTYVTKLNQAIEGSEFENLSLEETVKKSKGAVYNNAAQHWNHSFFWNCLSPNSGGTPTGDILQGLEANFGSFEDFKEQFSQAAATLFGAGWAWLAQNKDGSLEIIPLSNADTPITQDKKPLLTLDVWEHAYYIDYRNERPRFIDAWWEVVNWEFVAQNLRSEQVLLPS